MVNDFCVHRLCASILAILPSLFPVICAPSVDRIELSTRRIYSRIFHVCLLVQGIDLFFLHTIDILLLD
jgi:hypothetical protein